MTRGTGAAAAADPGDYYPDHGAADFARLTDLAEYQLFAAPPMKPVATSAEFSERVAAACRFEKAMYQHLVAHYLSVYSPYRSLLLFHQLGSGKTCSAITIAEALIEHSNMEVWVVLSAALKDNFEANVFETAKASSSDEIYDQCTGDFYRRANLQWRSQDRETRLRRIQQLIRSRYKFFTYDGFADEVARRSSGGGLKSILLIVDEVHNLRVEETDKRAARALVQFARESVESRMVLLTATPMYNEANEILWILAVLCANDGDKRLNPARLPAIFGDGDGDGDGGRQLTERGTALLAALATEYVSYIRGSNPFTFAARFSPSLSGIPILDADWAQPIRDGLVPVAVSAETQRRMEGMARSETGRLQASNFIWPSTPTPSGGRLYLSEKGFARVFTPVDEERPLQVVYTHPEHTPFYPGPDGLDKWGPKIAAVVEHIRRSEGIVLVYSQFVWNGVIPLALALSHCGMSRYGCRDLLRQPRIIPEPGASLRQSFAILTRDPKVMGDTNLRDLVAAINAPENRHGERVKVVLITPVAGEGISFKNIREVHVLDPWYHLNRLDQVIGRAIRKCSHTALPLEERNVSVFLHATPVDYNAYQYAARKARQTAEVEAILRDNAMDCPLVFNLNYYPKSLFPFQVAMRTSQGRVVSYQYGDDPEAAPVCRAAATAAAPAAAAGPPIRTADLVETGLQRLRKYIRTQAQARIPTHFTESELRAAIHPSAEVAYRTLAEALQPGRLLKGQRLVRHRDGFFVEPVVPAVPPTGTLVPVPVPARSQGRSRAPGSASEDNRRPAGPEIAATLTAAISVGSAATSDAAAAIQIYRILNSETWSIFAKYVIELGGANIPTPQLRRCVEILDTYSAWVPGPGGGAGARVGYMDLFESRPDAPVGTIYDTERRRWRDLTEAELAHWKRGRQPMVIPDIQNIQTLYGVFEAESAAAAAAAPRQLIFKLWIPGEIRGIRRGIVCDSSKKTLIADLLNGLAATGPSTSSAAAPAPAAGTKNQLCFSLGTRLLERGHLFIPPFALRKK